MNIDLKQARLIRNVDYFLSGLWFCLGVYLAFNGFLIFACFYLCAGSFMGYNAWRDYSFKSLTKDSWDLIHDLEEENNHLKEIIKAQELPGLDDYNEGYVE
jgi:hypothetical protein